MTRKPDIRKETLLPEQNGQMFLLISYVRYAA